ncbi:DNA sulfur modification protein DndD [Desertifilum sp. FACHB-1129]|uniref:Nuclease SbcCD subunit C n=1 Tax=Desertifilum tharense IPPAS B-1220 TaxID=1781255 RepID=A0A1E5QRQ7_9CYAN|nr:DNA sulfur modification protein DndD [Desertifilum tharense]MBD2315114.1 DNA sulfur modification protein DndD [Desertifilum sp. FACHB-1129]MBD2325079.1 DNA sulfur modification protein DndD [Desertifilum sp. FACHB-866]MBD2335254.1 DNA sulfur modification protein DndD [Desertifilum sp. FACHB-868]MDA0213620.1 DNA sulfur modification protein DndD [Cyanobacteria bacterium FC1]OEJ77277.1 DNA sulfur modification protein DndD [Desertifilum tharense IPPAS B-1220]
MKFLELVLENFGPYVGRQTINLSPDREEQSYPIILVGGMNGGGKTTLMDAIRLALYGSRAQCSTRGSLSYPEFLSQCVNRHTPPNDSTRVELLFEHLQYDRRVEYRIVRYWKRSPKEGKDTLGILEGDWKDETLAQNWDEYIENLLPLGISSLFLFDGEQVKELAELEAPPPMVVDAIQSLLGLELAERLAVDLDILMARKRKEMASAKELSEIEEIEQRLEQSHLEQQAVKQEIEDLQELFRVAKLRETEAFERFISEGGKIAGERAKLDQQLADTHKKAQDIREALCEVAGGVLPLVLIQPLLEEAIAQGDRELRALSAKMAQGAIQERDRRLLDRLQQMDLGADSLAQVQAFLEAENQALNAEIAQTEEAWLEADAATLDRLRFILNHQLQAQVQSTTMLLNDLDDQEGQIESLDRQISTAASPEIYEQLQAEVRKTQAESARIEAALEEKNRRLRELETTLEATKKELANYGKQNLTRQNLRHLLDSAEKVQQTLKLFKQKLTLKKLNKLEVQVTECFRYLLHKSDLVHRIMIDAGNFSLTLYDPQGQFVPKHRLSAGEKQLLAIAFLWGLARVSGRQLPVAIDTPLGRLDSSHRQNLVERYFPSASHQVILLSTDTEIGKTEVATLREQEAIAREYLLKYDAKHRQTTVEAGYFW